MAQGLFDDLDKDIEKDSELKSEKRKGPVNSQDNVKVDETRRRGRPRTAQNRVSFTLKPLNTTKRRLQAYATEHGKTSSDIVDALVAQFLDDLKI